MLETITITLCWGNSTGFEQTFEYIERVVKIKRIMLLLHSVSIKMASNASMLHGGDGGGGGGRK